MSAAHWMYRAVHPDGAVEQGSLQAESVDAVRQLLSARGLFPVEVRPERSAQASRPHIAAAELAQGLRVLATLLESGLPLARALGAMDDLVPPSWKPVVPHLRSAVREGKSLAAALGAAPVAFPPLVVGLVQAGEAGSGLAHAVARAAELTEAAAETRRAVRSALAYPFVLAGAGTASLALLVGFVLPRFAAILHDMGQQLPASARLVLGSGEAARAWWLPALLAVAGAVLAWRAWTATEAGRERWHTLLLAVPVLGQVRRSTAAAHFAAALGALLESGVPIAPALGVAVRATADEAITRHVLDARTAVVAGGGLAASLAATHAVTPTAVRMIRAGEESGRLVPMLAQVARIESARAGATVREGVQVLEPALILVFGALVALVAAALLQAVYSVRPVP